MYTWYVTYFIYYNVALGNTVSEIDVSNARGTFEKTVFSMMIPEVEAILKSEESRKSVVLFGIEVCIMFLLLVGYNLQFLLELMIMHTD